MQLSMTMLMSQIVLLLLLLYIRETITQTPSDSPEKTCMFDIDDSEGVFCESIDRFIDAQPEGRFFEALKKVESQGDFCRISEDSGKIGLYQISEEYYNQAVCFNEELAQNG